MGKVGRKPGFRCSEETRRKMSEVQKGKRLSEETKQKISAATRKKVMCEETGEVYESQNAAALSVGVSDYSISVAVKRGTRCAGYHWQRVNENSENS